MLWGPDRITHEPWVLLTPHHRAFASEGPSHLGRGLCRDPEAGWGGRAGLGLSIWASSQCIHVESSFSCFLLPPVSGVSLLRTRSEHGWSQLPGAHGLTTTTGVTILASDNRKKTPILVSVTSSKLTQDRKEGLSNSGSYGVTLFQGLLLPLPLASSGFSLSLAKQRDEYSNIQTLRV